MERIVVLTGGTTPERTVALAGAGQVVAALRRGGFEVTVVDTVDGVLSASQEAERLRAAVGREPPTEEELRALRARERLEAVLDLEAVRAADVIVPVLHGAQGEGGSLQTLLELRGLRFAGSDSLGSALAMDKDVAKRLLRDAGVPTPRWLVWPAAAEQVRALGAPLVVKPSRVGSTVGLTLVDDPGDASALEAAVATALRYDRQVILEEFLPGRELTVGVLDDRALGVGEIVPEGRIFDYESKYTPGRAREVFPAEVSEPLREEVRRLALAAHRALELRDFSRVDFRLDAEGRPHCLEVNTLPGMTPTSLLPQSATCVGIGFDQLVRRMVELALQRHP
ncbi:MAG TPA: D-alanine--D-alanine ligase [Thermoanaerobaculia bacterium]|nr:D-alanine--D-alanine ligase [Thermoanaerobaculia bacterium]